MFTLAKNTIRPLWLATVGGRSVAIEKHDEEVDHGYWYEIRVDGAPVAEGWFDNFEAACDVAVRHAGREGP